MAVFLFCSFKRERDLYKKLQNVIQLRLSIIADCGGTFVGKRKIEVHSTRLIAHFVDAAAAHSTIRYLLARALESLLRKLIRPIHFAVVWLVLYILFNSNY